MKVAYCFRDRDDALWFGSTFGLSRYVPEPDRPSEPGAPLIRYLRIAGKTAGVSLLGESTISGLKLGSAKNNLQIEFASLHFASGEVLQYQYRLDGADRDWSPATGQLGVNYSSLSPGRYRFVVRAVNHEGMLSSRDATISFEILPPVRRQAWFVALALCGLAGVAYAGHRTRKPAP